MLRPPESLSKTVVFERRRRFKIRSLYYVTSICGDASTCGADVPDLIFTVHLPAVGKLSVQVSRVSVVGGVIVACTGDEPDGPTACTSVTPAKPLPVIVKSRGLLVFALLGLICGIDAGLGATITGVLAVCTNLSKKEKNISDA